MLQKKSHPSEGLHELVDLAIHGDVGARDELERRLDALHPGPKVHQLAGLVEETFRDEAESLEQLERWFRRVRDLMIRSRQDREDLESLAYLVTIRVASRKLEARYRDVQSDPASIASRIWEQRFRSFLRGLEEGRFETVLQLISWIDQASEFTIQNVIREQEARTRNTIPIESDVLDAAHAPGLVSGPGVGDDEQQIEVERRREGRRALLRGVFGSLRGHHELFTIVVLARFCDLSVEQVGEILAMEPRTVYNRLEQAATIIGENSPGSP